MPRQAIVNTFAEWTAFSSTRSGAPIKSREDVYPLIRMPDYEKLFIGPAITQEEFREWHQRNTLAISENSQLQIGWAAKLINIYLKTRVYVGREGRTNLYNFIHPPIDNGLWSGITRYYNENNRPEILVQVRTATKIKEIETCEIYTSIINGCATLARHMHCELIEVEQLWEGTEF